jgi:hypothetical protein
MTFARKTTTRTLLWLDWYGNLREAGMNEFAVLEYIDSSSDILQGSAEALAAAESAGRESARAIGSSITEGMVGVGISILKAAGVTGAAAPWVALAGGIITALGGVARGLVELFTIECDKFDCAWPKTYVSRSIVGVNPPGHVRADDSGKCYYGRRHCTLYMYMHDGMNIEGISKNVASPDSLGRVRGVNGIRRGKNDNNINNYWKVKVNSTPRNLPTGNKNNPWETPDSWWGRAWRVGKVLDWVEDRLPCRFLKCMEQALIGTPRLPDDSIFNQKRRRGSRFYSSIVTMQKDVWEGGQHIGSRRFEQILRDVGASSSARMVKKIREGKVFDASEVPFPWWPVLKTCNFEQLRNALIKMKPLFPVRGAVGRPLPEGEAQRRAQPKIVQMLPMFMPPKLQIDPSNLMPIPPKIGGRAPSWPVIALGASAAAIGATALYYILREED